MKLIKHHKRKVKDLITINDVMVKIDRVEVEEIVEVPVPVDIDIEEVHIGDMGVQREKDTIEKEKDITKMEKNTEIETDIDTGKEAIEIGSIGLQIEDIAHITNIEVIVEAEVTEDLQVDIATNRKVLNRIQRNLNLKIN